MGFRFKDDYKRILQGGDNPTFDDGGNPTGPQFGTGPLISAFQDSVRAERAIEGLAILRKFTDFDPERNWADSLEPARGNDFRYAHDGYLWHGEGAANTYSGNRSVSWPVTGSFGEMDTPRFRIRGGNYPYICRLIYKADGADAQGNIHVTVYWYDALEGTIVDTTYMLLVGYGGTSGLWREEAVPMTPVPATARFASIHITGNNNKNLFVDYVALELCPPAFYAYNGGGAQLIEFGGAGETLACGTEIFDYGSQYTHGTGIFTCAYPGLYSFHCTAGLQTMSDNQEMQLAIRQNGSDRARTETGNAGAGQHHHVSLSTVLFCARGDVVLVNIFNGDTVNRSTVIETGTSFSGAQIRQPG
jgi:hypothetical protein